MAGGGRGGDTRPPPHPPDPRARLDLPSRPVHGARLIQGYEMPESAPMGILQRVRDCRGRGEQNEYKKAGEGAERSWTASDPVGSSKR